MKYQLTKLTGEFAMKRLYPFLFTLMIGIQIGILPGSAYPEEGPKDGKPKTSKTLVKSSDLLNINKIDCYVQNDGSIGENPTTGGDGFYFPAGQRTLSIIYTSGIWIVGKVGGEIRSAVNCYGSEFQPGSILSPGVPDDPLDPKYKIYKYNKGDLIDTEAIEQGCADSVLGDQMLFCVYNDITDHSGIWGSLPIGIEVQQTAFAFNQEGPLGNTVFVKYHVVNKSSQPFEEAYLSLFFDPDLGFANDD
jgi:hypothetical protein